MGIKCQDASWNENDRKQQEFYIGIYDIFWSIDYPAYEYST